VKQSSTLDPSANGNAMMATLHIKAAIALQVCHRLQQSWYRNYKFLGKRLQAPAQLSIRETKFERTIPAQMEMR
jgi:hypothetical protein